jgi:hypothetical protein
LVSNIPCIRSLSRHISCTNTSQSTQMLSMKWRAWPTNRHRSPLVNKVLSRSLKFAAIRARSMAAALVPLFWNFRGTRRNAEQLTQSCPDCCDRKDLSYPQERPGHGVSFHAPCSNLFEYRAFRRGKRLLARIKIGVARVDIVSMRNQCLRKRGLSPDRSTTTRHRRFGKRPHCWMRLSNPPLHQPFAKRRRSWPLA